MEQKLLLGEKEIEDLLDDFNNVVQMLIIEGKKEEKNHSKEHSDLSIHENVARKVFRRLLLRNAQLSLLTKLTKKNFSEFKEDTIAKTIDEDALVNTNKTKRNKINDIISEEMRAYKHAITDLFVEKALTYLEEKADDYSRKGNRAYTIGLVTIAVGIGISAYQYLIKTPSLGTVWPELISKFILAFTFYGFIVIVAVGLWRYGRAMLDQAERLLERRHALRQGRLFVHLHDGNMNIDDMEKAFNWNVSQNNAFGAMVTETKAPWGAVVGEAFKASAEIAKSARQNIDSKK